MNAEVPAEPAEPVLIIHEACRGYGCEDCKWEGLLVNELSEVDVIDHVTVVPDDVYDGLVAELDRPPQVNDALARAMQRAGKLCRIEAAGGHFANGRSTSQLRPPPPNLLGELDPPRYEYIEQLYVVDPSALEPDTAEPLGLSAPRRDPLGLSASLLTLSPAVRLDGLA